MISSKAFHDEPTARVLGFLGGASGIVVGILATLFGLVGRSYQLAWSGTITALGCGGIVLSVLGIMGSVRAKSNPTQGGWMMTGAGLAGGAILAIGGILARALNGFYIIPPLLLLIGGLLGLLHKGAPARVPPPT